MSEKTEILEHHVEIERKIINLMLNYRDAINELLDDGFVPSFFDSVHENIVNAIFDEYLVSNYKRLLERNTYRQILLDKGIKGNVMIQLGVWDKCSLMYNTSPNELGVLKKQLINNYVARKSHIYLDDFRKESKSKGYYEATSNLVDRLQSALILTEIKHMTFAALDDMKDEYLQYIENIRKNPETKVTCGIPEIDDPVNVGFKRQHMTLFVANVGNHKTNVMLNIALNIYDRGHSVLFIPLEMPREDLVSRIIANRAGISCNKLANPEILSDGELKNIAESKIWESYDHKFTILDVDERISVSTINREIEKRAAIFKPKIVVIDYIANLKPDVRFAGRNDLEIGEMLKTLRFMGKKYGFHTMSAAQLGREAIKALREGNENAADSTSIRGSHEYAADPDNIFILNKVPGEDDKLKIINIKARHGRSGFVNELRVDAERCMISSTSGTLQLTSQADLEFEINTPAVEIAQEIELQKPVEFVSGFDDDLDDLLGT